MKKYNVEDIFKIILGHQNVSQDYHQWYELFKNKGFELEEKTIYYYLEKLKQLHLVEKTDDLKYRYRNFIFEKQVQISRAKRAKNKEEELKLKIDYLKLFLSAAAAYSPSMYTKLRKLSRMGIQNFLEVEAI